MQKKKKTLREVNNDSSLWDPGATFASIIKTPRHSCALITTPWTLTLIPILTSSSIWKQEEFLQLGNKAWPIIILGPDSKLEAGSRRARPGGGALHKHTLELIILINTPTMVHQGSSFYFSYGNLKSCQTCIQITARSLGLSEGLRHFEGPGPLPSAPVGSDGSHSKLVNWWRRFWGPCKSPRTPKTHGKHVLLVQYTRPGTS